MSALFSYVADEPLDAPSDALGASATAGQDAEFLNNVGQYMQSLLRISAITICLSLAATAAFAELTATAKNPKYGGPKGGEDRLDQCFTLGKNCGQTAANKYCEIHGYQKAKAFETEKASPTQTMVGQRCTGSVCVAFKSITCSTTAKKVGQTLGWPQTLDN